MFAIECRSILDIRSQSQGSPYGQFDAFHIQALKAEIRYSSHVLWEGWPTGNVPGNAASKSETCVFGD